MGAASLTLVYDTTPILPHPEGDNLLAMTERLASTPREKRFTIIIYYF